MEEKSRTKISILVPVFNVKQYLSQCLDSILKQTFKDIEIICINNGAGHAETEILANASKNDKRIKIIRFEENQGYGKALNAGLEQACGEYIGIVESDDYIELDMYESLYKLAQEFDADIVKSAFYKFDKKQEYVDLKISSNRVFKIDEYPILFQEHPSIWSCIYKKEFLDRNQIRFAEIKGTGWVDNPFQAETLLQAEKIVYCEKAFYNYRYSRPASASSLNEGIMVPYNATKMVHEILHKLDINNKEILRALAWREKAYIGLILKIMSLKNRKYAEEAVTNIFDIMGDTLEENKKFQRFKKRYYKKSLFFGCIKNEFKKIVKGAKK